MREGGDLLKSEMVQVRSHRRQRQQVLTVITFASVSTACALQNGHVDGRATVSSDRDSYMLSLCNRAADIVDARFRVQE
jgi:hypothetical protein